MNTPHSLAALIEDGVIDEVLRPLKSGKEATIHVVRAGSRILCAKVYKDMAQRSFQATNCGWDAITVLQKISIERKSREMQSMYFF